MLSFLSIDDYELHADGRTDRWLEPNVTGLDAPEYRENSYDRAGEHGGVIGGQLYGMRIITLPGKLLGTSPADYLVMRRELQAVCAIKTTAQGDPILKKITMQTLDGKTLTTYGVTRKPVIGSEGIDWCSYQVTVVCPHPELLGDALTSGQMVVKRNVGTPFPWIFDPTIEFAPSGGGVATIDNTGTMDTWPILELTGVLTNPTIIHDQSGRQLRLNWTTTATDKIEVDMREHTVVLNSAQSLMGVKSTDSDWFGMDEGINTYRLTTDDPTDTGSLEVTGYEAHLGA